MLRMLYGKSQPGDLQPQAVRRFRSLCSTRHPLESEITLRALFAMGSGSLGALGLVLDVSVELVHGLVVLPFCLAPAQVYGSKFRRLTSSIYLMLRGIEMQRLREDSP